MPSNVTCTTDIASATDKEDFEKVCARDCRSDAAMMFHLFMCNTVQHGGRGRLDSCTAAIPRRCHHRSRYRRGPCAGILLCDHHPQACAHSGCHPLAQHWCWVAGILLFAGLDVVPCSSGAHTTSATTQHALVLGAVYIPGRLVCCSCWCFFGVCSERKHQSGAHTSHRIYMLKCMGPSTKPFTRQENTVIQTFVVASYLMAFTGGFGSYLLSLDNVCVCGGGG